MRFVKRAQELAFSLREIKELLALRATREAKCQDVRRHAPVSDCPILESLGSKGTR